MKQELVIERKYFDSTNKYVNHVKNQVYNYLKQRVKLLGLTIDDLNSIESIKYYSIGRDDSPLDSHSNLLIYRAMGISLLHLKESNEQSIISIPDIDIDYTKSKEWISTFSPLKN